MRFLKITIIAVSLLLFGACGVSRREQSASRAGAEKDPNPGAAKQGELSGAYDSNAKPLAPAASSARTVPDMHLSLQQADQSQTISQAIDRKIIKDAELTLEVPSPTEAQRKVTAIADTLGGFVVTSESKQRQSGDGSPPVTDVTLVMRVPATQFGAALNQIHAISTVVTAEKQTGQDVTEEFIDLEARIKTQKALEAQFLEIMKQAHKVEDALEVQTQIANVRGEIEKIEGRKRFLENRSSLSTITVNLNAVGSVIIVNASGFGRNIKEAVNDSIEVAKAIVLFLIRFVIVMIPVFLFVFLPIGLVLRYFVRRARRFKLAREMAAEPPPPIQAT
jgi:hypothetical protein